MGVLIFIMWFEFFINFTSKIIDRESSLKFIIKMLFEFTS